MDYERHLPLAPRDLLILAVLAEGPLHGYGIIKAVELRSESGVLLDPANLYRVLRRMRETGWIRESAGAEAGGSPQPSQDAAQATAEGREKHRDRRRRAYEVTPSGRALLSAELARLERLLQHARPALANGSGR